VESSRNEEALKQFGLLFAISLIVLAECISLLLNATFHFKKTRKSEGFTDKEETLHR
jgi:hypothetical protein